MVTAVLVWSLSVLVLLVALTLVVTVQTAAGRVRRLLHGRHGAARAGMPARSTKPGPRRGPGLVVRAQGGEG